MDGFCPGIGRDPGGFKVDVVETPLIAEEGIDVVAACTGVANCDF